MQLGGFAAKPLASLALLLYAAAFVSAGAGCVGSTPTPLDCRDYPSFVGGTAAERVYDHPVAKHTVWGYAIDWVGSVSDAVVADGSGSGCFLGGRIEGTFAPTDSWTLFHDRFGLAIRAEGGPYTVEDLRVMNTGDAVSLKPTVPCPSSSSGPWLTVRGNLLEDIHDDAIESDGLCAARIEDNLIDRAFVGLAFRNRSSDPYRSGAGNLVFVSKNLIRSHAFPSNYEGQTVHNGLWKWAHARRGPRITVRDNRFLAFDPPAAGTLFPFTNRVAVCSNNVLLFAGSEAEWQQALAGGCDDDGDDGLCDGGRMLALADCFTVVTKLDTQSEADFLAAHWDPYVAAWKAAHWAAIQ
jgi:hypothetical protein